MNEELTHIINKFYHKSSLQLSGFVKERESKEYEACRFKVNGLKIVSRNAKMTPKKVGQFVTFWKRNNNGITEPLDDTDQIDFYVINVSKENRLGQFVIPKSVLIEKGIISTTKKEGKRGFRVYPAWDMTSNKQAEKTQQWQLSYFIEIDNNLDVKHLENLYQNK